MKSTDRLNALWRPGDGEKERSAATMECIHRLKARGGTDSVTLHVLQFTSPSECQSFFTGISFSPGNEKNASRSRTLMFERWKSMEGGVYLAIGGALSSKQNYEIRDKALHNQQQKCASIPLGQSARKRLDEAYAQLRSEGKMPSEPLLYRLTTLVHTLLGLAISAILIPIVFGTKSYARLRDWYRVRVANRASRIAATLAKHEKLKTPSVQSVSTSTEDRCAGCATEIPDIYKMAAFITGGTWGYCRSCAKYYCANCAKKDELGEGHAIRRCPTCDNALRIPGA